MRNWSKRSVAALDDYQELTSVVAETSVKATSSIGESEGGWSSDDEDDFSVEEETIIDGIQLDTSAFVVNGHDRASTFLSLSLEGNQQQGGVHLLLSLMQKHKATSKSSSTFMAAEETIGNIISITSDYPLHARTQAVGCQVLQHLALFRENRATILTVGGVEALTSAMRNHKDHLPLQESCCWALEMLSRRSKHRIVLDAEKVIAAVASSLSYCPGHSAIQQRGLGTLVNLARTPNNVALINARQGVTVGIASLGTHKNYSPVITLALELLASLCRNEDNTDTDSLSTISKRLPAIIEAMSCHAEGCPLVQKFGVELVAIVAMRMLASTGLSFKVNFSKVLDGELTEIGGISDTAETIISKMKSVNEVPYIQNSASLDHHSVDMHPPDHTRDAMAMGDGTTVNVVISAMTKLPNHPSLQMNACIILACIASVGSAAAIIEAGGFEAIVQSMKGHNEHPGVQKNALVALANLCTAAGSTLLPQDESEALDVIIKAMDTHKNDVQIQMVGCQAIHHYIFQREAFFDNCALREAVRVIVTGMDNNSDPLLQEKACMALAIIVLHDTDDVEIAITGGMQAIVSAIKDHSQNASTVIGGLVALLNLSRHEKNRVAILALDSVAEVLLSAVEANKSNSRVLGIAIPLLHNLSLEECFRRSKFAPSYIRLVINTMKTHRNSLSIQETCCELLGVLASERANRLVTADAGGIQALVSIIGSTTSGSLARAACFAFGALAEEHDNKPIIADRVAIKALISAMDRFRDNPDVQCCSIMSLAVLSVLEFNRLLLANSGVIGAVLVAAACAFQSERNSTQVLGRLVLSRCSVLTLKDLDWCIPPRKYITRTNTATFFMLVWMYVDAMVTTIVNAHH